MTNQTIADAARAYVPQSTKNITELESVPINVLIQDGEGEYTDDETGKAVEFHYKFIEIDGEKFRMPLSVLGSLKAIMEKKPTLKSFAVTKQGTGRQTKYTVIPLD